MHGCWVKYLCVGWLIEVRDSPLSFASSLMLLLTMMMRMRVALRGSLVGGWNGSREKIERKGMILSFCFMALIQPASKVVVEVE